MARPSKKRSKEWEGIRRKGNRWEVRVRVEGGQPSRTFRLDTPVQTMQAWRESQRTSPIPDGSFAEDVQRYLLTVQHMPTFHERKYHLNLWLQALGLIRSRQTITTNEIDQVLSAWKAGGLSNTSVRHRRTALLHLFNKLDGKDAHNPVRASWRPSDPPAEARSIPPRVLRAILKQITAPKTKARLWVMASTGIPHKQLMQLTPESIDWLRSRVYVGPRTKGKGAPGSWRPLNRHARFAFRMLERVHGWGPFSPQSMRKRWQEALDALDLPKTIRPYDVRHTVGTLLYKATGDLATVARLLGHANIKTAARYSLDAHADLDAKAAGKIRLR